MILGMSVSSFTLLHVVLSLIGIVFGFLALAELIADKSSSLVSAIFLGFTVATSVTGFLFPGPLDPARIVGIISLVALGIALIARYGRQLARRWRLVYVVTAVLALYLNVFVAVVQAFQKIPALHARAPSGSEPPFVVAQTLVLATFIVLGFAAARRFRRSEGAALAR
jgi:positive regulator of sigma E activity